MKNCKDSTFTLFGNPEIFIIPHECERDNNKEATDISHEQNGKWTHVTFHTRYEHTNEIKNEQRTKKYILKNIQ